MSLKYFSDVSKIRFIVASTAARFYSLNSQAQSSISHNGFKKRDAIDLSSTESDESSSGSSSSSSNSDSDEETIQNTNSEMKKLYETHIPTTNLQKTILAVGSSLAAIIDPYTRDDMVAVFGETTGQQALKSLERRMSLSTEGNEILSERPVLNSSTIDQDKLWSLLPNTFGYSYVKFMDDNKITCDTRKPVKFVDDEILAYIMRRYRETHDMVHTLVGQDISLLGEVTVKWIEGIQTGLPMAWSGALIGPIRLNRMERRNYVKTCLPWALKCGHEASLFMNVFYEKRWEQDIDDLRKELKIPLPFPVLRK